MRVRRFASLQCVPNLEMASRSPLPGRRLAAAFVEPVIGARIMQNLKLSPNFINYKPIFCHPSEVGQKQLVLLSRHLSDPNDSFFKGIHSMPPLKIIRYRHSYCSLFSNHTSPIKVYSRFALCKPTHNKATCLIRFPTIPISLLEILLPCYLINYRTYTSIFLFSIVHVEKS